MQNVLSGGSRSEMRAALNAILADKGRTRVNGNVASHNTTTTKGETLHTCFNDLWDLGMRITNPSNISHKHIEALCRHWYEKTIAVSTMQARLSVLRIFAGWVGKSGLVKKLHEYLPDVDKKALRVKKAATTSKSWTENGIDVLEKINQADSFDRRFGAILRMCLAFGLRRMEVVQFKPHKSDMLTKIRVYEAKNGRQRDIDIEYPEQREILDMLKKSVAKGDHIGWKETVRGKAASLKYCLARYDKSMAKIGITREDASVTGHGLRAQYAENIALVAQMIPPTLGGSSGQMSKADLDVIRAQVSEKLGHSRVSVTTAYYGSFGRNASPDEVDRCQQNIEAALKHCHPGVTKEVPSDRIEDCKKLVAEMESIGVEMTMRQAQLLWEIHSQRHARYWMSAGDANALAMEVAAIKLVKQLEGTRAGK